MEKITYKITLQVLTPFSICFGAGKEEGISNKIIRNNSGYPYIPASTIKGLVRYYYSYLFEKGHIESANGLCRCNVCKIFGSQGNMPSRIFFEDLNFEKDDSLGTPVVSTKASIAIDRYRRAVRNKALFTQEMVENGIFSGRIILYLDSDEIHLKKQIEMAIKMIDRIGSSKSRGLGSVKVLLKEVK
ncbi:RAMP superfamily CRISPR-associated protein [Caldicellulosiruptoraceae bacterium PP1]